MSNFALFCCQNAPSRLSVYAQWVDVIEKSRRARSNWKSKLTSCPPTALLPSHRVDCHRASATHWQWHCLQRAAYSAFFFFLQMCLQQLLLNNTQCCCLQWMWVTFLQQVKVFCTTSTGKVVHWLFHCCCCSIAAGSHWEGGGQRAVHSGGGTNSKVQSLQI